MVLKDVGTVPVVREEWKMSDMRGTRAGEQALTSCVVCDMGICWVRCSLINTFDPFSLLPCFNSVVLCFLLTNLMMTARLSLSSLRGRGWHASM